MPAYHNKGVIFPFPFGATAANGQGPPHYLRGLEL